jgi:hypothetical protein
MGREPMGSFHLSRKGSSNGASLFERPERRQGKDGVNGRRAMKGRFSQRREKFAGATILAAVD